MVLISGVRISTMVVAKQRLLLDLPDVFKGKVGELSGFKGERIWFALLKQEKVFCIRYVSLGIFTQAETIAVFHHQLL